MNIPLGRGHMSIHPHVDKIMTPCWRQWLQEFAGDTSQILQPLADPWGWSFGRMKLNACVLTLTSSFLWDTQFGLMCMPQLPIKFPRKNYELFPLPPILVNAGAKMLDNTHMKWRPPNHLHLPLWSILYWPCHINSLKRLFYKSNAMKPR